MPRYYDLEKLAKMIEAKADTLISGKEAFLSVAKWLEKLPGANVKEVVYCEDCNFSEPRQGACPYHCKLTGSVQSYNDFCSSGQAKTPSTAPEIEKKGDKTNGST
jgi:hypothetical protein